MHSSENICKDPHALLQDECGETFLKYIKKKPVNIRNILTDHIQIMWRYLH